ncbi:hypothetical protein Rhal01_00648 [Rubritalea halochordaticola]|uniref:Uncharacterized protein n=1 Tax=Rubritalea halochordaticola TaxID=714537 RepID=A0ABP9UVU4_9BACT
MNLAVADLSITFIKYIRNYWLEGFANAHAAVKASPEGQQITLHIIQEYKRRTSDQNTDLLWDNITEEMMQALLWGAASIRNFSPLDRLQEILENDAQHLMEHGENPSPRHSRTPLHYIVSGATPFTLAFFPAWQSMTDDFKELLEDSLGTQVPDSISSLDSFLWLSKLELPAASEDEDIIASYQSITPEEADRLAGIAISQYETWSINGVIKGSGGSDIDEFIPLWLRRLVCFSKPLSEENIKRVKSLEWLSYDSLITHTGDPGTAMLVSSDEKDITAPYLRQGITLVPATSAHSFPLAVSAGHGEPLQLADGTTLLSMLDIDLTELENSFLGLNGTRIRICYPAEPDEFTPFFTKITLDGGVSLLDDSFPTPTPEDDYQPCYPLTTGRKLLSPCEGLNQLEDIGATNHIGGLPSQRCEPYYPESPVSGELMTFIAQFPHPSEGRLFVFLDKENLIAATIYEYD